VTEWPSGKDDQPAPPSRTASKADVPPLGNAGGTHVIPTRYLTADLPPIGGRIKQRPEDFLVDEQPLYEPSGAGEHIYMLVQKSGMATLELVGLLAQHFGVPRSAIGYAGLKDKHAITRQVVSVHVPGRKIEDFPALRHDRITVLWTDYHANKLRRGHLRGNRFSLRIRGVPLGAVLTARRVLERLEKSGVPNRIGEQRFGHLENNHRIGRALILGDAKAAIDELLGPDALHTDSLTEARALYAAGDFLEALRACPRAARTESMALRALVRGATPSQAVGTLGDTERGFFLSAFQSAAFNAVLDRRVEDGMLASLTPGDLAMKHDNGAIFTVIDATVADPALATRLEKLQISPTGPMWGAAMMRASGKTDESEVAALAAMGVTPEDLASFELGGRGRGGRRDAMEGTRRALRVPLLDPDVEAGMDEHGAYIRCVFELPAGAFATTVLREIMKPELAGEPPPTDSDEARAEDA
jgi:tRNA pseudouridine13 synthase